MKTRLFKKAVPILLSASVTICLISCQKELTADISPTAIDSTPAVAGTHLLRAISLYYPSDKRQLVDSFHYSPEGKLDHWFHDEYDSTGYTSLKADRTDVEFLYSAGSSVPGTASSKTYDIATGTIVSKEKHIFFYDGQFRIIKDSVLPSISYGAPWPAHASTFKYSDKLIVIGQTNKDDSGVDYASNIDSLYFDASGNLIQQMGYANNGGFDNNPDNFLLDISQSFRYGTLASPYNKDIFTTNLNLVVLKINKFVYMPFGTAMQSEIRQFIGVSASPALVYFTWTVDSLGRVSTGKNNEWGEFYNFRYY